MKDRAKTIIFNGEHMGIFTLFDPRNRSMDVTRAHRAFHERMNIPVNYIEIDYRVYSHGNIMEQIMGAFDGQIEYFVFLDNDALILRTDGPATIYEKLKDGMTVFGGAQNSNHINTNPTHPFVQPSTFCISNTLYKRLGRPKLSDGVYPRSDTCEEVTWLCEEKGYNVCMIWPRSYNELTDEECSSSGNPKVWKLTNTINYGLGTTYGDLFFHSGMQTLTRSASVFMEKADATLSPKIEAVTVCVGYSRFLKETIRRNQAYFSNYIVVTSPDDKETQDLCRSLNEVECVVTNAFYENGAIFNKGRGISEGLKKLKYNEWVCHIDCDILLPVEFHGLPLCTLNKNNMYGARRIIVENQDRLKKLMDGRLSSTDFKGPEWGGWGCGYFQLWHMDAKCLLDLPKDTLYPSYPTAGESDIMMLKRFHPDVDSVGKFDMDVAHLGNVGVNHDTNDVKDFFDENS